MGIEGNEIGNEHAKITITNTKILLIKLITFDDTKKYIKDMTNDSTLN